MVGSAGFESGFAVFQGMFRCFDAGQITVNQLPFFIVFI